MKWDSETLESWRAERKLLREHSRYLPGWSDGFIEAWGENWILLRALTDGCCANGYKAIKRTSLRSLTPAPHADFICEALSLLDQKWPPHRNLRGLDLRTAADLIVSVLEQAPLATIHIEKVDPEVCYIGRAASVSRGKLTWTEITPDATLEDEKTTRSVSGITRVELGGAYETALWAVFSNRS